MPDHFDTDPVAATWFLTVYAKDHLGQDIVLLEQDIEWMTEPDRSILDYGFERWKLFTDGADPMCPADFRARFETGDLYEVRMELTARDFEGTSTVRFGPVGVPRGA